MKIKAFSIRITKELLRDKLNLAFGIGFPIVLLLLLSLIQSNIPVSMFELDQLTPGIAVFGLSFISLFSATIISKDRSSAFMQRMYTSPMTAAEYIAGYTLPLIPISILQMIVCFLVALVLGLKITVNILLSIIVLIPAAIFFIALGLLCGSSLNDKQVGGVCGALLTNLSAWLSGTWFDTKLVGGVFETIANILPFSHAVNAGRYALAGEYSNILPELIWVVAYAIVTFIIAIIIFTKKMKSDKI